MTRLALSCLCLTAVTAAVDAGASPFADAPDDSSSMRAETKPDLAATDKQGMVAGSTEFGAAIYSPFSTAAVAGDRTRSTRATTTPHPEHESLPGFAVTTVAALVAAGLLVALVRVLTGA